MSAPETVLREGESVGLRPVVLEDISAPENGAVFYLREQDQPVGLPPGIKDVLLSEDYGEGREMYMDAAVELQGYMRGLLANQRGFYDRNLTAAWYAEHYRSELGLTTEGLSYDQQSVLTLSQLYLSSVLANSKLRLFFFASRETGRGSPDANDAKREFLVARKMMQEDVDAFLDHFDDELPETKYEALADTINMARMVTGTERFVDSEFYTNTHILIGSVLSERMVKVVMQEMGEEARYADEHEEVSPIGADVVSTDDEGNVVYLQVKMRWNTPDKLRIKKEQTPPHIVVPMGSLRSRFNTGEARRLRKFVRQERKRRATLQTGVA